MVDLTACCYYATYAFQSESTLYNCLNVKELLARSRHQIWSLSDCNWTRTQNHLVRKRRLNRLAKLTKWLSCVLSTYLYGAFDYMLLSCHVRVSEWIHRVWIQIIECGFTLKHIRDMITTYSQKWWSQMITSKSDFDFLFCFIIFFFYLFIFVFLFLQKRFHKYKKAQNCLQRTKIKKRI